MKKIILSTLIALLSIVSANAQFYIGGSFGYNSSTTKPEEGDKIKSSSFTISPEVGYHLNDKLELGLAVSVNPSTSNTIITVGRENIVTATKTQIFLAAPYLRYSLFKFNKFNVLGSVILIAGKGRTETEIENSIFGIGNATEIKYTIFGASIYPTVIYDLSNKVAVFSNLNFFKLGFSQTKIKDGNTTTDFSFALDANDILLTIGLMYKF
ncbi:hypothetical protein AGMMS50262_19290 [Bacteroidia bacterium]|nr:hypothetical protein AGMMS50262_19290 [Bacteroidia bacterium]